MMNDNALLTSFDGERAYPLAIRRAFECVSYMPNGKEAWEHAQVIQKIYQAHRTHQASLKAMAEVDFEEVFLKNTMSGVSYGRAVYNIHQKWGNEAVPTLTAIALEAADFFHVSEEDKRIIAIAAALGSVENPLAFHNVSHTRKTLLQLIRLIRASFDLGPHDIAKLLIAACIQDVGHDGKGNSAGGKHVPMRLEMQALQLSLKYMENAGLSSADFKDITVLVCGTDVTPLGSYKAPARMVAGDPQKLPDAFYIAKKNAQLLRMTRMMAIADVACAAAMCPEMSYAERSALSEELNLKSIATMDAFGHFMRAVEPMFQSLPETIFVYGDAPNYIQNNVRQFFAPASLTTNQPLELVSED